MSGMRWEGNSCCAGLASTGRYKRSEMLCLHVGELRAVVVL